MIEDDFNP